MQKRATVVNKGVVALRAELTQVKATHVWLVDVTKHFASSTEKAQANLQNLMERQGGVEKKVQLVTN